MRLVVAALALGLAFLSPALAAEADEAPGPHVTDPGWDVHVTAAPSIGIPEPSVDLRAVTFLRESDDLVVVVEVEDVDFRPPYPVKALRSLGTYFVSKAYEMVMVYAIERDTDRWGTLLCVDDGDFDCGWVEETPTLDASADTVTMRVPLDLIGGRVLQPRASSFLDIGDCYCLGWPNLGAKDFAPNQGYGTDFDPYTAHA